MSRKLSLSIIGLYEYNTDVFAGLNVPEGMDRQTVIDEILMECGGLELLYPSYTFMKMAISNWSKVEENIWNKLHNSESFDYNPLWNVDANIVETLDGLGVGSTKGYNEPDWLENDKAKTDNTITTRRTGNIGVTSSQQLIREERDVADFSTYKYIVESFKKRFCLMVY